MEILLAIATLLGGITAIWFFLEKYQLNKNQHDSKQTLLEKSVAVIEIKNPLGHVINQYLTFGLLHIRDGKDQVQDHELLLNQEIKPEQFNDGFCFQVIYATRLGFQFKCYVDYFNVSFHDTKLQLQQLGFQQISKSKGTTNRAWFILSEFDCCKTNDGFINNYYYPV